MRNCCLFPKPEDYYESGRDVMFRYMPQNVKGTLEFGFGSESSSEITKEELTAECRGAETNERAAQIASEKPCRVTQSNANESLAMPADGHFDYIILNDVLEHLADFESFIRGTPTIANIMILTTALLAQ